MGSRKRASADDKKGPGIHSAESDETVEGGKYQNADGKLVNAAGRRINDDGTELTDEEIAAEADEAADNAGNEPE